MDQKNLQSCSHHPRTFLEEKKIDKVAGDVNKAINFRNISGLDTVQKWIPLEVGQNTLDN